MNDKYTFIKEQIKTMAMNNQWVLNYYSESKELFGFYSYINKCHMDIYARSLNVVTCLKHPNMGVTSMVRNNVGLILLDQIMKDPRIHTIKGKRL